MKRKDFLKSIGTGTAAFAAATTFPSVLMAKRQGRRWDSQNYTWISHHGDNDDEARKRLEQIKRSGLNGILPSGQYERWVRLAQEFDLDVHAWWITLQRGADSYLIENHPDWFMVNRMGQSSVDYPAYVDYYKGEQNGAVFCRLPRLR